MNNTLINDENRPIMANITSILEANIGPYASVFEDVWYRNIIPDNDGIVPITSQYSSSSSDNKTNEKDFFVKKAIDSLSIEIDYDLRQPILEREFSELFVRIILRDMMLNGVNNDDDEKREVTIPVNPVNNGGQEETKQQDAFIDKKINNFGLYLTTKVAKVLADKVCTMY